MTLARYLIGLVLAGIALGPVCAGALMLRRRLLPGWHGALARLAEIMLGLGIVIAVAQVLGTVGLFRLAPMVVGLAAAGVAAGFAGQRRDRAAARARVHLPGPAPHPGRAATVIALVATAVVTAEWFTRTSAALRQGMFSYDTLWYHLPAAARFVQDGTLTGLHYFEGQPGTVFQPFNSGILHALGIMFLGNDLLSPFLNLAFLALALLAGWCIGIPSGVAPVTMTGVAVIAGTPEIVASQAGGGYPDIAAVALVLAAVAILVHATRSPHSGRLLQLTVAGAGVAGLAAGLALGTKVTAVAPVAVLTAGLVVLAPATERLRSIGMWVVGVVLGGGFWFVRNLVAVGNPLPTLERTELGPFTLPSPPIRSPVTNVARYVFDGQVWRDHFLPGLDRFFGPAWWAVLALVVAGLSLSLVAGRLPVRRVVALAGIAGLVAYIFGPQILDYVPGDLFFLVTNLRYALPGIFLGLVLLPTVPLLAERRGMWVLATFALVLAATQFHRRIWAIAPIAAGQVRAVDSLVAIAAGAVVLGIGATLLALRRQSNTPRPRSRVVTVTVVGFVGVAGGFGLQQAYLDGRYTHTQPRHALWEWAQGRHDERIAIVGDVIQYPFYGKDLSNHVQYVGARGPHGAFAPIDDCADWRRALNAGRYSYVVIAPERFPIHVGVAPEAAWTKADSAATLVMTERDTSLFRLDSPMDPNTCGPS